MTTGGLPANDQAQPKARNEYEGRRTGGFNRSVLSAVPAALFSQEEWPGGKNLPVSPATWRKLFETLPSPNQELNFDPSHLVWH